MQSLFKPGSKINQDHKHKYIHILAYAASVVETWKKVQTAGFPLPALNEHLLMAARIVDALVDLRQGILYVIQLKSVYYKLIFYFIKY